MAQRKVVAHEFATARIEEGTDEWRCRNGVLPRPSQFSLHGKGQRRQRILEDEVSNERSANVHNIYDIAISVISSWIVVSWCMMQVLGSLGALGTQHRPRPYLVQD